MYTDQLITFDEAVELTGIPPAELVTHLELFRDPEPGVVRVSTHALEKWNAQKALPAVQKSGRGNRPVTAVKLGENGLNGRVPVKIPDQRSFEVARDEKLAELERKLEQVAVIFASVRRADHVLSTARAIVLLERLRHESGEKDILGRVAWRLRSSLKAVRHG